MVEIDPGLDAKLRAFFEHVEASSPPSGLAGLGLAEPDRRRRTFNVVAGLAAAAIVAATAAVFAVELGSHHGARPAPAATSAAASQSPSASPSLTPLAAVPLLGPGGIPTSAHVVIQTTRGRGSAQLQEFFPQGTLYIQFSCAGPGSFDIDSTNRVVGSDLRQCSRSLGASTITVEDSKIYDDKPLTLKVTADPSMVWAVYIAESRAPLPEFTVRPDEQVLVPVTYGTGSITLPTFSVGPHEWVNVQDACNSGSTAGTLEMVGNGFFGDNTQYQCSSPSGAGGGSGGAQPGGGASGPISVHVKADPAISWEILITEGPQSLELPSSVAPPSADFGVAPATFGMGSGSVPAFTPTKTYSIAFVCSGVGALTIASSNWTHVATPSCGGGSAWFTPTNEPVGQPVSLSVEAPPSVGWEIFIYQVGSTTSGACSPSVRPGNSTSPSACLY